MYFWYKEFFDAHPHLAQRFPGGVDQFAQMVAGLPPDLLGDLMIEALDGQPGGMPGGLDGLDVDADADNIAEFDRPNAGVNPALAQEQEQVRTENDERDSEDETEDVSVRDNVYLFRSV